MTKNNKFILMGFIILISGGIILFSSEKISVIREHSDRTSVTTTKTTRITKRDDKPINLVDGDYNFNLIKNINKNENDNYLVSPYSVEFVLNMLKDGASGETYSEIENVVGNRSISLLNSKNRISTANAIFVKDDYKKDISKSYIDKISSVYNSEIIFDKLSTPDIINNWASEHTYKMINEVIKDINPDYVMGLINAVAIDVEWKNGFECESTSSSNFDNNGKISKVEMMNNKYSYDVSYIKSDNEEGIILPYYSYLSNGEIDFKDTDKSTKLEFIALKPLKEDVSSYVDNLSSEKFNEILEKMSKAYGSKEVRLSLPRFEYDYNNENMIGILKNMGINKMFNGADFSKITDKYHLYVSKFLHKTHISLNEKGTKAAAVTYAQLDKAVAEEKKKEIINIKFDKPFMYVIRDSKTKEMLFFGVVKSPNIWKGITCKEG